MRIKRWHGNEIRFVEKDGEWWAILMDTNTMERVQVEIEVDIPSNQGGDVEQVVFC